jgi:hypothetical protein
MRYFAEIRNNEVVRVIVAEDISFCTDVLGGEWVETFKGRDGERFAGKGMGYAPDHPMKFVPRWNPKIGQFRGYAPKDVVLRNGVLWENTAGVNRQPPGDSPQWQQRPQLPPQAGGTGQGNSQ